MSTNEETFLKACENGDLSSARRIVLQDKTIVNARDKVSYRILGYVILYCI
jgi:hypothetical protein